jgi:hypothetical protein
MSATGTFVSLKNETITLSHGGNKKDTTHAVDPACTATINGNTAKLADLQAGDDVSLSGDPVTSVSAKR